MKDVTNRDINVGDHVGVAFSYSQASVGHIRLGVVEEMNGPDDIRIRWDADGKLSPKIRYGNMSRWILL